MVKIFYAISFIEHEDNGNFAFSVTTLKGLFSFICIQNSSENLNLVLLEFYVNHVNTERTEILFTFLLFFLRPFLFLRLSTSFY